MSLALASERFNRLSWRRGLLAATALAASLLVIAWIVAVPTSMAYLGVFGFSALANAVLFLPSGRGAVMVAGALALDPLAVGIIAGVGGALGELTGYALGRSSHRLVRGAVLPGWLSRYADRHMGATLLAMYTIPSPFMDAAGILAGRLRYPLPLFLTYSLIGKVVQSIVFVYLVLWNVSLFNSWAGLA